EFDLSDLLQGALASKPDHEALHSAATSWTWRELDRDSDRLAAQLIALGLKPGDRAATLMPNRNVLLVFYMACLKARLVITPLNYRYMAPEIDHALEVSGASVLLAHAEREADLAKSERTPDLPLGVIRYGSAEGENVKQEGPTLEGLLAAAAPEVTLTVPQPDDPAVIFFTSGSTGKPKGVTHTRRTYGAVVASSVQSHAMTEVDVVLPGSSISHAGGFFYSFMALAKGAKIVMPRTFDGDEILPLLREQKPTLLWMLPAALIALMHDHNAQSEDFSSVRLCTSGGDKVPAELEREFTALAGFPVDEIWGMSEIGIATVNPPAGLNKLGSVGQLGPGYEASLRDEEGNELSVGEPGRMWIRAKSNMIGYWNRPDATAETIVDGWLDTGDVMQADEQGYFWFQGRKKQIIIHDGSNICPQEVEEALLAHPAVESAGVVGVHDLVHGENVWAYITFSPDVLKPGESAPSRQEVVRFARERVGYKAPEVIKVLEEMPLNATGKVDRVILKKWAADQLDADH
ncbi:MAG: class I adenylate-forming enzyme family protein, partial [Pseudomonadota bacterium]